MRNDDTGMRILDIWNQMRMPSTLLLDLAVNVPIVDTVGVSNTTVAAHYNNGEGKLPGGGNYIEWYPLVGGTRSALKRFHSAKIFNHLVHRRRHPRQHPRMVSPRQIRSGLDKVLKAVEGEALLDRGMRQASPEDLKRAVELLTLKMKLPPPITFANEPQLVFLDRLDAFTQRARANYGLQQYTAAIEDSEQVLSLLPQASELSEEVRQRSLERAYLLIIGSYLHLGEFAKALSAASEWERRGSAGTEARSLREAIETQPFGAEVVLNGIDRFIYHP
jgi:tetratricopeptide (TPR) repeat protein